MVSQYETCKIRTIKAGTLEKLVENLLTAFGDNDFTYISIFLSTYRGFASTKEVLELLLDRYWSWRRCAAAWLWHADLDCGVGVSLKQCFLPGTSCGCQWPFLCLLPVALSQP